ncbi:hypothetical protein IGI04_024424, partial [Brassica rapa subsp. trilocularis]
PVYFLSRACTKLAGFGWIFEGSTLISTISGSSSQPSIGSPLIVEAIAVRSALCMAITLEISFLRVFFDNSTFIRAISNNHQSKEIIGIVHDIRLISSEFASLSFSHFSRSENSKNRQLNENGSTGPLCKKLRMDCEGDGAKESLLLIKQGAEARVFESTFVGRRSIVKERFSKKYRHPILDVKLTLKRLNAEARCMTKARKLGVCTPVLYAVDPLLHSLTLEYIEGVSVKDVFLEFGANGIVEERLDDIAAQIGEAIAKLHDGGLAHGDLTTSNMLVRSGTNQLVLIDFGLSFTSTLPEDKAVDLYVLERALLSMHSSCGNVMERILTAYRKSSKQWSATFNKLAQVRQRGRKRTMIG